MEIEFQPEPVSAVLRIITWQMPALSSLGRSEADTDHFRWPISPNSEKVYGALIKALRG